MQYLQQLRKWQINTHVVDTATYLKTLCALNKYQISVILSADKYQFYTKEGFEMDDFKFKVCWKNVWGGQLTQRFNDEISATLFYEQLQLSGIKAELMPNS